MWGSGFSVVRSRPLFLRCLRCSSSFTHNSFTHTHNFVTRRPVVFRVAGLAPWGACDAAVFRVALGDIDITSVCGSGGAWSAWAGDVAVFRVAGLALGDVVALLVGVVLATCLRFIMSSCLLCAQISYAAVNKMLLLYPLLFGLLAVLGSSGGTSLPATLAIGFRRLCPHISPQQSPAASHVLA